jgi:hypothetical protein
MGIKRCTYLQLPTGHKDLRSEQPHHPARGPTDWAPQTFKPPLVLYRAGASSSVCPPLTWYQKPQTFVVPQNGLPQKASNCQCCSAQLKLLQMWAYHCASIRLGGCICRIRATNELIWLCRCMWRIRKEAEMNRCSQCLIAGSAADLHCMPTRYP